MTDSSTPSDQLMFDEEARTVDDATLYERLAPFVQIGDTTGRTLTTSEFSRLDSQQKLVVALLTPVAKQRLEILDAAETSAQSPVDIARFVDEPIGDVYSMIRHLERTGLLHRTDRQYQILPENHADAVEMLPQDGV